MNNERRPTEFEIKVLRRVANYGDLYAGDGMVHYAAAARRLEGLGYLLKAARWHVTDKGERFLDELRNQELRK